MKTRQKSQKSILNNKKKVRTSIKETRAILMWGVPFRAVPRPPLNKNQNTTLFF